MVVTKLLLCLFVALTHFNGLDAMQCYNGSGSPSSPAELSPVECSEGIINCLKMVISNEDGSELNYQYQCGTNAKKESGCINQDPSQPFYDDDLDSMMDEEMGELEKDVKEMEEDAAQSAVTESSTHKVHTFPPNAKISKSVRKQPVREGADWSIGVEESVRRVKREALRKNMFCYCNKNLCNGSATLTAGLSGISLALLLLLSRS